jgi:hypothetical protein
MKKASQYKKNQMHFRKSPIMLHSLNRMQNLIILHYIRKVQIMRSKCLINKKTKYKNTQRKDQ